MAKQTSRPRRQSLYPNPPQKRFYAALGKLSYRFAQLEATAYETLLNYVDIPEDMVRAVTGGLRLSNICGALRRLAKLRKYDLHSKDEIGTIIDQINVISILRDRLIHRQANVLENLIESNNLASYKMLEDLESISYSLADIAAASLDLEYICARLRWPFDKADLIGQGGQRAYKIIERTERKLLVPWLYKSPPLYTPLR